MFYIDTSAALKFVLEEPESTELIRWMRAHSDAVISSDLLRTELLRATKREAPELMGRARVIIESIFLLRLPPSTFERSAEIGPDLLRSLDAIHLAAALELGDELDGFITYDDRQAAAANLLGFAVLSPR